MKYGGIEAGGTKWICGIGSGPRDRDDGLLRDHDP